jgi:hypothetical protein
MEKNISVYVNLMKTDDDDHYYLMMPSERKWFTTT